MLELLPVAPVVTGEVLPCIVLSAWLAAQRLLSSLRSTHQGNRVMWGISMDSCDPALPSTQHYRDGPLAGGGSALVPKRCRLYYRMYSLMECQQASHAPLLPLVPSHPLL